ncbi:hypothetical protein N7471_001585 [Penicillium samsonianum]|uniref:uncharacterized protein n=1 Tax=Penicillium samsonianum TaxID=1882272 RepID=UPI002547C4A9|nr:uncharacterized protein N7471_001585 [Penicillium samsonianum]KAJ6150386.1 hypothetical protein N7471_001585 [Penicillium samsonianum]
MLEVFRATTTSGVNKSTSSQAGDENPKVGGRLSGTNKQPLKEGVLPNTNQFLEKKLPGLKTQGRNISSAGPGPYIVSHDQPGSSLA